MTPVTGKAEWNKAAGEYSVTGGGANIWGTADAFYFAYKKVSGDVAITADVRFIGAGTVAHRKAALMIRQSLDADSAYADAAVHGDGLTSLQFRPSAACRDSGNSFGPKGACADSHRKARRSLYLACRRAR